MMGMASAARRAVQVRSFAAAGAKAGVLLPWAVSQAAVAPVLLPDSQKHPDPRPWASRAKARQAKDEAPAEAQQAEGEAHPPDSRRLGLVQHGVEAATGPEQL